MPVLSLSEVDIPADRIGIPSMRNPPPARVLPDESRFLAVEIIAVVAECRTLIEEVLQYLATSIWHQGARWSLRSQQVR